MDFSKITDQYSSRLIKALSIKENSTVYTAQNPDGGLFVLRIYDRPMPGYQILAEHQSGGGLPQVYSCRMEQGFCVVEEEFIDGISLQELIDGGEKMTPQRAVSVISSVCRTLLHLHRKGVIHRDVKPEHVMLTTEGKIYLIDLDAAMRILPEKKSDTRLLGTAGYAAPEQFGLNRSDVRTDVFAVGILLNLLLTGEHPAVVRFREGVLGQVIETCTAINPQDRYQNMTELLENLEKAGAEEAEKADGKVRAESGRKTGGKKRLTVLAGVLCLVILLGAALLFGKNLLAGDDGRSSGQGAENGQIRTASFTTASYDTSDKNYILCKKDSKDTYTPISSAAASCRGTERPALIFLAEQEDRTFYLLTEKPAETLELPVLNCYRELTQDSVAAEVTREADVRIGDGVYAVWQVQIDPAFEGAVRAGVSLNGKLAKYEFLDIGTRLPNFLWILDETYVPADFSECYDGDLIPFAQNPSGQTFASRSALEASALKLGSRNSPVLKQINMSLTPYDDENAFFLVHPAGTSVQDTTTQLCAFDQEGAGFGAGGAGGGVFSKSVDSVFSYSPAGSVVVGGLEMQVTKVKLKEYRGHEDIQAVFTLTEEEGGTSSGEGPAHYASVRLQMGMNIVVLGEGLTEQDVISIDSEGNLLEKALGFTPLSQPLKFVKSGDRYEGFYPLACALISEEGQGRMLSLNVEIPNHCRIRDLTDGSGKSLAYVVEQRKGYVVTDADGNPIYDQEAISARGWKSGITGTNAGTAENRVLMDVTSCVAVHTEDYAKDICRAAVGQGNTADLEAFLNGHDPDGNPNHAELRMSYMKYTIYFNPADDAARNEIVFHVTKF